MDKESFVIYTAFYKPISALSDEQLGRLFRAIFDYNINGSVDVDDDIRMPFEFFINQFALDKIKYEKRVERNRQNGKFGGNPNLKKGQPNPYYAKKNITQHNPTYSNITEDNQDIINDKKPILKGNNSLKKDNTEIIEIQPTIPSNAIEDNPTYPKITKHNPYNDTDNDKYNKEKYNINVVQKELPKKFQFKAEIIKLGVEEEIANDFMAIRQKKKAVNSARALKVLQTEADKAELTFAEAIDFATKMNWRGFFAEWYFNEINKNNNHGTKGIKRGFTKEEADRIVEVGYAAFEQNFRRG